MVLPTSMRGLLLSRLPACCAKPSQKTSLVISQLLWRMHAAMMRCGRFSSSISRHGLRTNQTHFEMDKGTLHSYAALAQEIVEVLLWVIQLPHVGFHKPGHAGVSWAPSDDEREDDSSNNATADSWRVPPTLHPLCGGAGSCRRYGHHECCPPRQQVCCYPGSQ